MPKKPKGYLMPGGRMPCLICDATEYITYGAYVRHMRQTHPDEYIIPRHHIAMIRRNSHDAAK